METCFSFHLFSSNGLTELCSALYLPEVKLLDVSKNNVENISPDFLTTCPKLETLNASNNKICKHQSEMDIFFLHCQEWRDTFC